MVTVSWLSLIALTVSALSLGYTFGVSGGKSKKNKKKLQDIVDMIEKQKKDFDRHVRVCKQCFDTNELITIEIWNKLFDDKLLGYQQYVKKATKMTYDHEKAEKGEN